MLTDFEAMAKKTVLKSLLNKYAPKSLAMQQAIKFDQAVITAPENTEDADLTIDAFDTEYVDNEPQPQEATAEEVTPSDTLFGNEEKKGKK